MEAFEKWDPAGDIETPEDVIGILETALEENDPEFLRKVMSHIVRSRGWAAIIRGMAGPVRADSSQDLSFSTVARALDSLGFRLSVQQKRAS